jgi:Protein of unknown function (DUF2782)
MRLIILLFLSGFSASAFAGQPLPDNLEALPPPALNASADEALDDEPAVTISTQSDLTIEEFRSNGRLYMIKVTPKIGLPYYLIDSMGDGKFARQESLDSGLRPPRWILKKF